MVRILLVDDDASIRARVRSLLADRMAEATVEEVGTLREALACATTGGWSAIVLDLCLGEDSGLEVLRALATASPATPVVVVSTLPAESCSAEALRLGAAAYIPKLQVADELVPMLRSLTARQPRARATEEQLRTLVEHLGDATMLLDAAGRLRTWNAAATQLFGYTAHDALALALADLLPPDEVGLTSADLLRDGRAGRVERMGWCVHRDGQRIWSSLVLSPIRQDGVLQGFAMIVRDESLLLATQNLLATRTRDLEHSNADLESFAALASHDLQEPLRKIRMFADRQRRRHASAMPAEANVLSQRIEDAAARMQSLIDSVLGYATMASRARPVGAVDLASTIRLVMADLEPRLAQCGGRIECGPLPTIEGDGQQFQQLFQNLLANGLKFMRPDVPPLVRVTSEPDGGTWVVRVEDNGIGFDQKHAERIFGLLQRLHGRVEYEGSGMGLAICRRIVECHAGTIRAEGRPGEGAIFTMVFPATQEVRTC